MVKNPPANAGDSGSIPASGRAPGEGNGNPFQCSCLGNPMDRGGWQATVHGVCITTKPKLAICICSICMLGSYNQSSLSPVSAQRRAEKTTVVFRPKSHTRVLESACDLCPRVLAVVKFSKPTGSGQDLWIFEGLLSCPGCSG